VAETPWPNIQGAWTGRLNGQSGAREDVHDANGPSSWRRRERGGLIFPQVFGRHIVLRELPGVNFSHVRVGCTFHSADRFGFKGLPLLEQFLDALRASLRDIRQPLSVPRLAG